MNEQPHANPKPMYAAPSVEVEVRPDGTRILRSRIKLPDTYTRCLGDWLVDRTRPKPTTSRMLSSAAATAHRSSAPSPDGSMPMSVSSN